MIISASEMVPDFFWHTSLCDLPPPIGKQLITSRGPVHTAEKPLFLAPFSRHTGHIKSHFIKVCNDVTMDALVMDRQIYVLDNG